MEDTKKKFAVLKKKLTLGFICTLPFFIVIVVLGGMADSQTGEAYGLPIFIWVPISLLPILIYIVLTLKYWRCPACSAYLGKNYSPNYCPKCGVKLQ